MQDLEARVVLVTGPGGGIGRAIVLVFAEKRGKSLDDCVKLFANKSPRKRLIEPGEVAHLARMIAAESASGITGQAINIDGGAVIA